MLNLKLPKYHLPLKNSYCHNYEKEIKLGLFYEDLNQPPSFSLNILKSHCVPETNWPLGRTKNNKVHKWLTADCSSLWTSEFRSCVLPKPYSTLKIIFLPSSQQIQNIKRPPWDLVTVQSLSYMSWKICKTASIVNL